MDFEIKNNGEISNKFLKLGIKNFKNACDYIANLPYRRNTNKDSLWCVFEDHAGTCSTKHSTLRKLSLENDQEEIKLMLGIFKMDAEYASKIEKTLNDNKLHYIPEAHNYLKFENQYLDFTKPNSKYSDIKHKIIEEKEIEYDEINSVKIQIHKKFLKKWIEDRPELTLEKIWRIREKCIHDLQN